jgi:signal transduction histidine kinase
MWLVTGASFIGLALINAVWLFPSLSDVKENAATLRLAIARRAADHVESFIGEKMKALQNTAAYIQFAHEETPAAFDRLLKENPEFNTVSLLDESLHEYKKQSRFRVITEEDLLDYSSSTRLKEIFPDKAYQGAVTRRETLEPTMLLGVPVVFEPDKRRAVLLAELNLKTLSELISNFTFGQSGKVYLVDQDGLLIIDPDISLVLKKTNVGDRPVVRALARENSVPALKHLNERGVVVEASGLQLKTLGWSIINEQNLSEVNALGNRIIILAALSSAIGFVLLFLLSASSLRLVRTNQSLKELLEENYTSGKMLIQRDLELTRANQRLEELDTLKSEFVSVAAHQLRTPLASIRWSLNALQEKETGPLNAEQRKILNGAHKVTLLLIELINDLLNVARIEEGRFGYRFIRQPLRAIITEIVPRFEKAAGEKGINISVEMPERDQLALKLDGEKIAMAIDNLLDNAIKYTPPGGSVTLKVFRRKNAMILEVKDSGIGIPRDQLSRIFDKFFRADNALLFQTSGTGLGLYVVKNVVDAHGGTVNLESREGKGTTITMSLPIKNSA